MQDISLLQQIFRLGVAFLNNLAFLPFVLGIGIVLGIAIALIRFHRIPVASQLLAIVVEIIRGSPFLIIVYAIYFALPYVGIELGAFQTGIVVLSVTATAYLSEVFRSGLMSLDKGQFEAAEALGMNYFQKLMHVVLPQIIKSTMPSIVGQIVMTIKDTSIVSLVGMVEIVRTSRQIMQLTLSPFTAFSIVSMFFILVCYPLIVVSKKLEGGSNR
ncbi:polar amino acid ABC transporter permease [Mesotoga sp. SC_NapDC2]|uniref:amino acid ABC transporter permease n=1 Tax=unclassified Mesotoga TaxID=1184398 RepID=UPI000B1B1F8A|nr:MULTISPECIES: amino acid ABC transporter permease [unclassified Mesotoga]PNQ04169.1 polar amino acid ABC transporter permease [Mesotoga sp. SC_NapDC3]PXF33565.1 polar amino acid ABC transporter permease [Mesotoga sp. SC_NapDC]RAM58133.1 polar amino acid ABC transporter permease [Mesotoga sp. SC_4PWL113PWK15]RIZ60863.1 polar amino acid ABC transporter permease [Mesotoga sp. SC_NapDC2]MDD3460244.1 amino acid ABC transporter permease [Mesotoga sp.]